MLISNAEIAGRQTSLRCRNGVIVDLADRLRAEPREEEIDARGGALLPGLHDHHLHLFSLAAHLTSVPCGPPAVESIEGMSLALRRAKPVSGWLRGTGYFESVAGELDRSQLDAIGVDYPLRIQHRSGSMWFLNSLAIDELGLDQNGATRSSNEPIGLERDESGRATGRLFRADDWLRERLPARAAPDLSVASSFLASCGITRLTDATPTNGVAEAELFRAARRSGTLPQRLRMMGDLSLSSLASLASLAEDDGLEIAEYKILLDEPALPDLDVLAASIRTAHRSGRSVAIHAVTRTEIHFALAALEMAGVRAGDRLEHASLAPLEAFRRVQELGLSVVTQPNFISERGDAYSERVATSDLNCLYRVKSWLETGVPLAAGTDAPFGDPDPWQAICAAVTRRTESGIVLGPDERVSPETALQLFTDDFLQPATQASIGLDDGPDARNGGAFTNFAVGERADFCLLDAPWQEARQALSRKRVAVTICAGRVLWSAGR